MSKGLVAPKPRMLCSVVGTSVHDASRDSEVEFSSSLNKEHL